MRISCDGRYACRISLAEIDIARRDYVYSKLIPEALASCNCRKVNGFKLTLRFKVVKFKHTPLHLTRRAVSRCDIREKP